MQVKLLRALQEQEIMRVGGTKPIKIDVRIIAATNRNLEDMVKNDQFREDLYYRLTVFPISIPPLRFRKKDITPLACLLYTSCRRTLRPYLGPSANSSNSRSGPSTKSCPLPSRRFRPSPPWASIRQC